MLPLKTLLFLFWFKVMTPRLISSHHSCQELISFPGIALQMIDKVDLAEIQAGGSKSPSIQSRSLSLRLHHFWSPKKALRGKRFTLDDDVKQYMRNWFTTQPWEFYETAIHRLVSQWNKCLNSLGQYF